VFSVRDGKKIYKTFPTLAAATGWRSDATTALRRGTLAAPTKQTVAQAGRDWIAKARTGEVLKPDGRRYKPAVIRNYAADLDRYVFPAVGQIRLSALRRRDLQMLVDRLVAEGHSGSKVRNVVMPLRAVCRRAIRNDELVVNPTSNLELPEAAGARDRVASPAEAFVLLEALPEEDRALWATAFLAGLRRGELRGLRDDDVDLDARLIYVRRGWDDVEGEIDPKSKKGERSVPIAGELRRYLLAHRARTGRRGADLFFGRTATAPFTPTHVRERALKSWAAAVVGAFFGGEGLPVEIAPIGLHELRHTYVSIMHAAGRSLEEIGDYVGHSSAYMTDRYRHLIEGQRQEAADALDSFLAIRTGAQSGARALGIVT
jgi:integrase